MLSIEECRGELGEVAKDMADEQVKEVRDSLYAMAELALDVYIERCFNGAHMTYLSYLMGASKIEDKDILELGIGIEETKSDGDRCLRMTEQNLPQYIELIKQKLDAGFWNEIVGEEDIIFIFKFKDNSIKEYKLSTENEQEVDKLCAEFASEQLEKTANVYKYISDNKFYHDFMMEHYADLIKRT